MNNLVGEELELALNCDIWSSPSSDQSASCRVGEAPRPFGPDGQRHRAASRRRIEPCMRFSRTRLTDIVHRLAYASVGLTVPERR